jgi:hypothetical protein
VWQRAQTVLTTYFRALGLASAYNLQCLELLLSPRRFLKKSETERFVLDEEFVSTRGSLMGEPGTKIVLTVLTKVAECLARQRIGIGYNPYF